MNQYPPQQPGPQQPGPQQPGYYGMPPQQHGPQQPSYNGLPPQQQRQGVGINIVRVVIGVIAGFAILGSGLYLYSVFGRRTGDASDYSSASESPTREIVVVDEFSTLQDGTEKTWKVPPGTYRVELTATEKGASLVWTGAPCEVAKKETTAFTTSCTVTQTSQLTVRNPTLLGLGGSTTVTVKVTKLP